MGCNSDRETFQEYFKKCDLSVNFLNLKKTSVLVSPCPPDNKSDDDKYSHVANFVRKGQKDKIEASWKMAFQILKEKLKTTSNNWWLSTSGDKVAWLHIRIDPKQKIQYDPYKIGIYKFIIGASIEKNPDIIFKYIYLDFFWIFSGDEGRA